MNIENASREHLLVGVCTFRRPHLLANCLKSLALQSIPDDISVSLVVVDNEPEDKRRSDVAEFAERCPFPVHYVHQPCRGIASARNSILDRAVELSASWIAMIDDDETAAPDWIAQLMAPDYRETPVLSGRQIKVKPEQLPFWADRKPARIENGLEGSEATIAYTNNVRFSSALIDEGLRFNESLGYTGGEDSEFFTLALLRGFTIKHTTRAITYEYLHPKRLTLTGQLYRAYWVGASVCRQRILRGETKELYLACITRLPSEIFFGALGFLTSPIHLHSGLNEFRHRALNGLRRIAHAAGVLAGLADRPPRPYRKPIGE